MAIFGFIVLCAVVFYFTILIVFYLVAGGEEFSPVGLVEWVIWLTIIIVVWGALLNSSPFKLVINT